MWLSSVETPTSAYTAGVTQADCSRAVRMISTLQREKLLKPLTDGAMMKPPPTAEQAPASPSCGAPRLWPSSCAMISAEIVVPCERVLRDAPCSAPQAVFM